jgi:hypothetical protein
MGGLCFENQKVERWREAIKIIQADFEACLCPVREDMLNKRLWH